MMMVCWRYSKLFRRIRRRRTEYMEQGKGIGARNMVSDFKRILSEASDKDFDFGQYALKCHEFDQIQEDLQ